MQSVSWQSLHTNQQRLFTCCWQPPGFNDEIDMFNILQLQNISSGDKNINNNLQPKTTKTGKNKFPDGESVEQQLTIIPRLTNKRRGSIADHAFPELHQKVVEIKKITWDERIMLTRKKHVQGLLPGSKPRGVLCAADLDSNEDGRPRTETQCCGWIHQQSSST